MRKDNWSITLIPHRSLSREGFVALMVFVIAANMIGAVTFLSMGAWPIVGFLGADVLLVYWAFKQNYRDQRVAERIIADADVVKLIRYTDDDVTGETVFNRPWVRVELEYDSFREMVGRLLLVSKGQSYEIAAFLGAEERASLAKALKARL